MEAKWKKLIDMFAYIDSEDADIYYLEGMGWLDYVQLYLQLKILRIVHYRMVEGGQSAYLWGVDDPAYIKKISDCSDDIDYDTLICGLEEFRLCGWNPPENEIDLTEALMGFDEKFDWDADEDEKQSFLEEAVRSCLDEYFNDSSNDKDVIAKQFIKICQGLGLYEYEAVEYNFCICKFPWIHEALCRAKKGAISNEVSGILQRELQKLDNDYCYTGQDSFYCIEVIWTTETTWEHYPTVFTPLKLALLEKMAQEVCQEGFITAEGKESESLQKAAFAKL